jgi:hypothetical protein
MIVLAITVPLVFGSLTAYDRARVEESLVAEIGEFIATVQLVYTSGPGNSAVIDFDVASGGFTSIDYVLFGDSPSGTMASAVRYAVQGEPESVIVASFPNVPMTSQEGEALQINSGEYKIMAECKASQEDLNVDGYSPDAIISLSLAQ